MSKPREINEKMLIPNTTQVPNVIMDWMMHDIGGPAFKILMFFIRQRYGFQTQYGTFQYSIGEICNGITMMANDEHGNRKLIQVCAGTGLTRESVVSGIKQLEKYKAVSVHSRGNRKKMNVYELEDFSSFIKSENRLGKVGNPTSTGRENDQKRSESRTFLGNQWKPNETNEEKEAADAAQASPNGSPAIFPTSSASSERSEVLEKDVPAAAGKVETLFGRVCKIRKAQGNMPLPAVKRKDGKKAFSYAHKALFGQDALAFFKQIETADGLDDSTEIFSWAAQHHWKGKNGIVPADYDSYKAEYKTKVKGKKGELTEDDYKAVMGELEKKGVKV